MNRLEGITSPNINNERFEFDWVDTTFLRIVLGDLEIGKHKSGGGPNIIECT